MLIVAPRSVCSRATYWASKSSVMERRIVFHVTDITVPNFDAASAEGKRIEDTTRRSLTEDLLAQYVAQLQNDLGATINMDAVRRAVSGSSSDQN